MQVLSNKFATQFKYQVVIVGCGGTGGFVAEGLCRILEKKVALILIDPDRVEERNLRRQNFFPEDLGLLKSEALAKRLSPKYDRAIGYSTLPIGMVGVDFYDLIIGCVDNGPARSDIAKKFGHSYGNPPSWWIDSGNGENFGQVLIGNYTGKTPDSYRDMHEQDVWEHLPLPTIQRPDLLIQRPASRNCADIADQGPTINQSMAALVIEVVRRLIAGTCHWMQLYLDMDTGTLQPVLATPGTIEEIIKTQYLGGQ